MIEKKFFLYKLSKDFFLKILLGLLPLIPYSKYIYEYPFSPRRDWDYFNSLSLFIRESIFSKNLPILDPWVCGGIDVFANPQNWLLSPLFALHLIMPPYIGNLFSIWILTILGQIGAYYLFDKVEDKFQRYSLSILLTMSPFYFLHFAEGHLPFRTFLLLPWIFYLTPRIGDIKMLWWLLSLLAFMFLDGGIYPFYFSIIFIILNAPYRESIKSFKSNYKIESYLSLWIGFILLISSKAYAVLSVHSSRIPQNETTIFSFNNIIRSLFEIDASNYNIYNGLQYAGHEYGNYLGIGLTLLFLIYLRNWRSNIKIAIQIFLFYWISFGIFGDLNPWTIIKKIPYLNHIHVQSRFLIISYSMLLLFISKNIKKNFLTNILLVVGLLEMMICAFLINTSAFTEFRSSGDLKMNPILISETSYTNYIPKPEIYSSGKTSFFCYEPAKNNIIPSSDIILNFQNEYLKIVFNLNQIIIKSPTELPEKLLINRGWNGGWKSNNAEVFENKGIIQANTNFPVKELTLTYFPDYLSFSIFFYTFGILFMIFSFRRVYGF